MLDNFITKEQDEIYYYMMENSSWEFEIGTTLGKDFFK